MKKVNRFFIKSRGITLIELLVAASIIITSTTVVLAIILSSFRGSNKINSNEKIRQNGNAAIAQMSRMLQFADSFDGASKNGVNYVSVCPVAGDTYSYIRITYAKQTKILSCANDGIKINGVQIIDSQNVRVVPSSCSFVCDQDNLSIAPVIGINFDLALINSGNAPEKSATLKFSTSVKMRNQ